MVDLQGLPKKIQQKVKHRNALSGTKPTKSLRFLPHTFQMRDLSQYNRTHHQEYNIFGILVGGFNPIWKIWVKMGIFPNFRGESKKCLKPPPSLV